MERGSDLDPDRLTNDLLAGFFVPAVLLFAGLWAAFRFVLDGVLLSYGLERIAPGSGVGATIVSGQGRFLLLVVLTAVLMVPYVVLYARYFRSSLDQHSWADRDGSP